jgi:hypothetical protein
MTFEINFLRARSNKHRKNHPELSEHSATTVDYTPDLLYLVILT